MSSFIKIIAPILLSVLTLNAGVYEDLEYGDTKQEVTDKLMACNRVENTVPKTMFGRVGLNGTFRIKKALNGVNFSIFFDWNEHDKLKEISLRSDAIDQEKYSSTLRELFKKANRLITEIYGPAIMANPMPKNTQIGDGTILNSHLWHIGEGTLLMGIAKEHGNLHLSISFLEKRIEPIRN